MNVKKLVLNVAKLIALFLVLSIGIPFVLKGYQLSQERPTPELPITFQAEMRPKAGPKVGSVRINLTPSEAFVTGDKITADIEVRVYWLHENETAYVDITFMDCLAMDYRWAWTNVSHYNELRLSKNSADRNFSVG